ncbi:MAG TPA: AraC family transcriptional regulator [Pseudonocardiaceae bacterium]|nr:AraC family transcriptional regulator [Pseudonocardiaceae bacterium]
MLDDLALPQGLDGWVGHHVAGMPVRAHRHVELEVNLVIRGTATYLLGERRYRLGPGTLTWLFPAQDHVLVDQSADHELWWAVFAPELVSRIATGPLLADDPAGEFCRRVPAGLARRLRMLCEEIHLADIDNPRITNTGLAYLLALAWQTFLDSDDIVTGTDVHPAVRAAARLLQTDPDAGDLPHLARVVGLSPSHLSRLFKAQTGIPLNRYRNQQRLHRFHLAYGNGEHTTALAAALAAGFGSYAQFYRVFRQETGRNPGRDH